jgi:hypothetical protein
MFVTNFSTPRKYVDFFKLSPAKLKVSYSKDFVRDILFVKLSHKNTESLLSTVCPRYMRTFNLRIRLLTSAKMVHKRQIFSQKRPFIMLILDSIV